MRYSAGGSSVSASRLTWADVEADREADQRLDLGKKTQSEDQEIHPWPEKPQASCLTHCCLKKSSRGCDKPESHVGQCCCGVFPVLDLPCQQGTVQLCSVQGALRDTADRKSCREN